MAEVGAADSPRWLGSCNCCRDGTRGSGRVPGERLCLDSERFCLYSERFCLDSERVCLDSDRVCCVISSKATNAPRPYVFDHEQYGSRPSIRPLLPRHWEADLRRSPAATRAKGIQSNTSRNSPRWCSGSPVESLRPPSQHWGSPTQLRQQCHSLPHTIPCRHRRGPIMRRGAAGTPRPCG